MRLTVLNSVSPVPQAPRFLFPAAPFIFLAAAARTGIIPTNLVSVPFYRTCASRFNVFSTVAEDHLLRPRLLHGYFLSHGLASNFHRKQFLDHVLLNALDHLLKHLKTFFLIFLQRVFLAITAQTDALFQVIHVKQVIFPQGYRWFGA